MVLKIPKVSVSTIFLIIPILYFNSCTFEFIKHSPFVLPVVVGCVLLWCIFLSREGAAIKLRNILPMAGYALILGVLFLMGAQNRVSVLTTDLMNTIYLLFFMCVFSIYSDENYKSDRSFILFFCLVDTVISCVYSLYRLIDEPNLSRLLSTGSYHKTSEAISARGIVSFGVIYGLALILIVLFFLVIQRKENRILNIFLISLFVSVLFLAQFLIAIMLVAIGVIWIIFKYNRNNGRNNKILFLSSIIVAVICISSLPFLFKYIVNNNIFGYEINARLQELLMLFSGEDLEGTDISVRFLQYFISLSAFISSFGLGKITINSVDVGSHSEWLDGLGNYGLLFVLYIVAIFMFRKFVLQRLPCPKSKQLYRMAFVIYIIMSLINTSTWAPITLSLCVIVPFLCLDKVS